jgi:hypothetical protein
MVSPNDVGRVGRRVDAEAAYLRQQLSQTELLLGANDLLNDGRQLALKRPMPPRGPLSKTLNDHIEEVLDR